MTTNYVVIIRDFIAPLENYCAFLARLKSLSVPPVSRFREGGCFQLPINFLHTHNILDSWLSIVTEMLNLTALIKSSLSL